MLFLIALSVFVTVTAGVRALVDARTASAAAARQRLERVALRGDYADWQPSSALRGNRLSSIGWMQRLLADVDFARSLETSLIRADWKMRVSEFLGVCLLTAVFGGLVGVIVLGELLFGLVLMVLGAVAPWFLLRFAVRRRIGKIEKQLVELLVMLSNSLKAGFGLMQAVDQAARQLDPPIADELKQLRRDMQVGSTIEEAVTDFGRRIGSYDVDIIVTAILVQRNVGGNLSEILDTTAHTIRERERIRGEIKALTAEGKVSGVIIGILPPALAGIFMLINRSYMMVLFTEPAGRLMLGTAILLELLGIFAIKKIISIEV
jgi:tight adherence protein B